MNCHTNNVEKGHMLHAHSRTLTMVCLRKAINCKTVITARVWEFNCRKKSTKAAKWIFLQLYERIRKRSIKVEAIVTTQALNLIIWNKTTTVPVPTITSQYQKVCSRVLQIKPNNFMTKTMVVSNLIRKLPLGHYNTKLLLCNVLQPRGHACSQKFQASQGHRKQIP